MKLLKLEESEVFFNLCFNNKIKPNTTKIVSTLKGQAQSFANLAKKFENQVKTCESFLQKAKSSISSSISSSASTNEKEKEKELFEGVKLLDQTQQIRKVFILFSFSSKKFINLIPIKQICPTKENQLLTPIVTPNSFFILDESKIIEEINSLGKVLPLGFLFE